MAITAAIDAGLSTATMIGAGVAGWLVGGFTIGAQILGSAFGTLNTKIEEIKYCEYEWKYKRLERKK